MKFLCWNCQGLSSPLTVHALKTLVVKEKPDVIFLMETKNREQVISRVQRRIHFSQSYIINPEGKAGGLTLLWQSNISISVELATPDFIDTICTDTGQGIPMRLTYVHAPATPQLRQPLWTALRRIAAANSLPWVCAGDFNEITYPWEKVGQRSPDFSHMHSFREVLHDCALLDIESKGCAFTCSRIGS